MKNFPSKLAFRVRGKPATAGSKRAFHHKVTGKIIVIDMSKRAKPWRAAVKSAALLALDGAEMSRGKPLRVEIEFVISRPKSHYRTGKYSHIMRDKSPVWHLQPPDVDKMSRALMDAMTGVVYKDDCLVVQKLVTKLWTTHYNRMGAYVTVAPLDEEREGEGLKWKSQDCSKQYDGD